ncbi:MAG: type II secretion system secretin GspD [Proteobacteria bacterium]|nr:type II secretion system secretin GspD [Pseudomonadota bacterium]
MNALMAKNFEFKTPVQLLTAIVLCILAVPCAHAQTTPNFRDADIRKIVEAVGEVTGKTFILDPRVTAKVTILSKTPMSPEAFYEAFLSILQVHGYIAITTGDVVKIIPDATARQHPNPPTTDGAAADDMVTQVIQVHNIGAAQLVPILRPLIPQYGHLAAHPGSNMLIISDRANNVKRMINIIRRIDLSTDDDIEVVPLEHASSAEIVRVLTALTQAPRADGMPVTTSLVADARTNSILIGGDKSGRLRLRALIAHLDTPLEDGGSTRVRYLRYADAENLATKLQTHFTQQATAGAGTTGAVSSDQVSVWADPQTNAIIVNAPPKMMRSLMSIVDKLDIRRAQVLVEAIIVEVLVDRVSDLGITWAVEGSGSNTPVGITNFPAAGTNLINILGATQSGGTVDPTGSIGEGISIGIGRIVDGGTSFAAILSALEGDATTNIISTPTIVTLDNEEASLNVGQEVPFVTGSFTNTGTAGGAVNPFQTIQREQVGVKLTITPQINEGNAILLKISQEISSISEAATGAADLITNQRTIDTTVIVEDGAILVLGGLIEDVLRESTQQVPILGSIPVLGALFRHRSVEKVKTNLMIFIRPTILRDGTQAAIATHAKYNYVRDVQLSGGGSNVRQMRNAERPVIPPLESYEEAANAIKSADDSGE